MKPPTSLIAALVLLCCSTAAVLASDARVGWLPPAVVFQAGATLQEAQRATHAWVVVVTASSSSLRNHHHPNRSSRSCGQAGDTHNHSEVLAWSRQAASVVPAAVRGAITQAMQQLQALTSPGAGRCPFPLTIDALPPGEHTRPLPAAVLQLEPAGGRLLLHTQLLLQLRSTPVQVVSTVAQSCTAAWRHLLGTTHQVLPASVSQLVRLLPRAVAVGLAVGLAAAVPRWLCIACPIVLGLLAPLVINAGVGEAADLACKELQLPDDECVELWFAALGLGMLLSLLAALPIYRVCRLYECSHPNASLALA